MSTTTQIPKNLLMNILSFICNIIIGLLLVPFLVGHLGIAAYGLIPLAMVFTEYVSLITQSFNMAVTRFLTIELQGNNKEGANAVFNSSLAFMLLLALAQVFIILFVLEYLESLISIPAGLFQDTLLLFAFTFAGFVFSMVGSVFSVSMYSMNRIDLMRINDLVRILVRTATIVLFFCALKPSLVFVGVGNFFGGISFFILSIMRWQQLTPSLKINFRLIELSRIKPIAGMAMWVVVNTVGYLLFLRIDTYIINKFLGSQACGEYSAVLQWSQLVRVAAGVISGVVTPLCLVYYAQGERTKLVRIMTLSVKLMTLGLSIPLVVLCVFSSDILSFWLGQEFKLLGQLMSLQLCTLVVNLGILPLFAVNTATNNVRIPAIISLVMGACNFILALLFVRYTCWGYYGVALAGVIVLTLKNAVFTPIYAAHVLDLGKSTFIRPVFSGFVSFSILYSIAFLVRRFIYSEGLFNFIVVTGLFCAISLTVIAIVAFTDEEKIILTDLIPQRLKDALKGKLIPSHE